MSEKKIETFLTIALTFSHENELKRYVIRNQSWLDVQRFRDVVFSGGVMVPAYIVDPGGGWSVGTWFVVSPYNVKSIEITKQDHYFKE